MCTPDGHIFETARGGDPHARRATLDLERAEVQAQIATLQDKLHEIDEIAMTADRVTDVIDGVCLHISRRRDGRWREIRTVADDELGCTMTAILYEIHGSPGCWAVRINQVKNACTHNRERWYGGHVIGLGDRLSYEDARQIAEDWVVRGQGPSGETLAG